MVNKSLLLPLLGLAVVAHAGRSSSSTDNQCQKTCGVPNQFRKYQFEAGTIYSYEFNAKSSVVTNNNGQQNNNLEWKSTVNLNFESTCEVVLNLQNYIIDGKEAREMIPELTKYPVRAVFNDGIFEKVCVDEQDSMVSINIKKGILSSIQNSLPSNSTMYDGFETRETDVLGVCPTVYKIKQEESKVVIEKNKNHVNCEKRYSYLSASPESALLSKLLEPSKSSESFCTQTIENGILKFTKCSDKNELRHLPGASKFVVAEQISSMTFISEMKTPDQHLTELSEVYVTDLLYEYKRNMKKKEDILKLENLLRKLYAILDKHMIPSANEFSELTWTMNNVPESGIHKALVDIRSGQYGTNNGVLEQIYLDAVSATTNAGAIDVMVDEILKGRHVFRYTTNLFVFTNVCKYGVLATKKMYEEENEAPVAGILSAGSIVGSFCNGEENSLPGGCLASPEVNQVMDIVSSKLHYKCSREFENDEELRISTIVLLKSISNMKRMNDELISSVTHCLHQDHTPPSVKIVATEAFKSAPCNKQVTKNLLNSAIDQSRSSEVRIFSYKAAIFCSEVSDIERLLDVINNVGDSSQVTSFVLSDLANLQKSTSPDKLAIREKLSKFDIVPQTYESGDSFDSSVNIEFSEFSESGNGAEISLDLIFEELERFPINVRTNFSIDLLKEHLNIYEMGARFGNWQGIFDKILKDDSFIAKSFIGKMIRGIMAHKTDNEINDSSVDFFFKLFGKDIYFSNMDSFANVGLYRMPTVFLEVIKYLSDYSLSGVNSRQLRYDLHIPTLQGVPLMFNNDFTIVSSFKNVINTDRIEISPIISAKANSFVGYKFGSTIGLNFNNTLISKSDLKVLISSDSASASVNLNLPSAENSEVMKLETETSLIKHIPGQVDREFLASFENDPRLAYDKCLWADQELDVCVNFDIANISQESDFPFVKPSIIKIYLRRKEPTIKSYEIRVLKKVETTGIEVKLGVHTQTDTIMKSLFEVSYDATENQQSLFVLSKFLGNEEGFKVALSTLHIANSVERILEIRNEMKNRNDHGEMILDSSLLSSPGNEIRFKANTHGRLLRDVDLKVDVQASLGSQSKPMSLDKLEIFLAHDHFTSEVFVRKIKTDEESVDTKSQINFKWRGVTMIGFKLENNIKTLQDGYTSNHNITLESQGDSLGIMIRSEENLKKRKADLLVSIGKTLKIVHLVGNTELEENYMKTSLLLDLPTMAKNLKFQSKIPITGKPSDLELFIKSHDQHLVSIRGLVSFEYSDEMTTFSSNIGVRFPTLHQNLHIACLVDIDDSDNIVQFKFNRNGEILLDYEHNFALSDSSLSLVSKIKSEENWTTAVNLKINLDIIEYTWMMKVPLISSNEFEGHFNMYPTETTDKYRFSWRFFWASENNIHGHALTSSGTYHIKYTEDVFNLRLDGEYNNEVETYQYNIQYLLSQFYSIKQFSKSIKIDVRQQYSQILLLNTDQIIAIESLGQVYIYTVTSLLMPNKKVYSLDKKLEWNHLTEVPFSKVEVKLNTPDLGKIDIYKKVTVDKEIAQFEGKIEKKTEDMGEKYFTIDYNIKVLSNNGISSSSVDANFAINTESQKLTLELFEDMIRGETLLSIEKNGNLITLLKSTRDRSSIEINLETPSGNSLIQCEYKENRKSLIVIPNSQNRKERHAVIMQTELSSDESIVGQEFNIEVHHEGVQKKISSSISYGDIETVGEIEFDVFNQRSHPVKLFIKTKEINEGVFKHEMYLSTEDGSKGPLLLIDTSSTDKEEFLSINYKKSSSSNPTIMFSSRYNEISEGEGTVSMILKSPDNEIQFGGTLSSVDTISCNGYRINSNIIMQRLHQPFMLQSKVCQPGFIEIYTGTTGVTDQYIGRAGLQNLQSLELSLVKKQHQSLHSRWRNILKNYRNEFKVVDFSAKLSDPETLVVRAHFNMQDFMEILKMLKEKYQSAENEVKSMINEMVSQVSTDIFEDIPELQLISESIKLMLQSLNKNTNILQIDYIIKLIGNRSMDLIEKTKEMIVHLELHNLFETLIYWINTLRSSVNRILEVFVEKVKRVNSDEFVNFTEYLARYFRYCPINENICKELAPDFEAIIIEYASKPIYSALEKGETFIGLIMEGLEKIIDKFEKQQYIRILENVLISTLSDGVWTSTNENGIDLHLKLRQPVNSLQKAFFYIEFFDEWSQWLRIKSSDLNPVRRRRFIVNKTYLLYPFYNNEIHLPKSKCEYYLAKQYRGATMTMKNLNQTDFILKISFSVHKVELDVYNGMVFIDGTAKFDDQFTITLISEKFIVHKKHNEFMVDAPGLYWKGSISKKINKVGRYGKGFGAAYDRVLNDNMHDSTKLLKLHRYLVDQTCHPEEY